MSQSTSPRPIIKDEFPQGSSQFQIQLTVGPVEVHIIPRTYRYGELREYFAKTRVYVNSELASRSSAKLVEFETAEASLGDRRWAPRTEFLDVDKLYDQLNREVAKVQKAVAGEALGVLVDLDNTDKLKVKFSRNAGCSCGCSPGVIVESRIFETSGFRPVDIFLSLPTQLKPVEAEVEVEVESSIVLGYN